MGSAQALPEKNSFPTLTSNNLATWLPSLLFQRRLRNMGELTCLNVACCFPPFLILVMAHPPSACSVVCKGRSLSKEEATEVPTCERSSRLFSCRTQIPAVRHAHARMTSLTCSHGMASLASPTVEVEGSTFWALLGCSSDLVLSCFFGFISN